VWLDQQYQLSNLLKGKLNGHIWEYFEPYYQENECFV
jgi:hypothetical protein